MPTYKLNFLNLTGLGEPLRFLLSYGGVDFIDERWTYEEWYKHKPKMPMEQLPTIEIDGTIFHQSRAIGRYFAKKFGLHGADDLESITIDAYVDDIEDMRIFVSRYYREKDPVHKAKLKDFCLQKLAFYTNKFEKIVEANGGFFVGNRLTWPDLHFSAKSELISNLLKMDYLQDKPALSKLYKTVRSIPEIKAYLDKRPKTDF